MLADGGECLSDLAVLREQPELFGPVASTPTAWRVVERTAQDPDGLAQLPAAAAEQPVLVRSDSAGASTRFAWHLRHRGVGSRWGMPVDAHVREAILAQPEPAWIPAVHADGQPRPGARSAS
jgi:hypothetical protein